MHYNKFLIISENGRKKKIETFLMIRYLKKFKHSKTTINYTSHTTTRLKYCLSHSRNLNNKKILNTKLKNSFYVSAQPHWNTIIKLKVLYKKKKLSCKSLWLNDTSRIWPHRNCQGPVRSV